MRECFLDLAGGDRAHPAQVLGEDQVGLDPPDEIFVQDVDRFLPLHELVHQTIDLPGGQGPVLGEGRVAYDGLRSRLLRVVAFVCDAGQLLTQAEREHDLGGRRQERDDPHARRLPGELGKPGRGFEQLAERLQRSPRLGAVQDAMVERE